MRLNSVHLQLESYVFSHINIEPNPEVLDDDDIKHSKLDINDIEIDLRSIKEPTETSGLIISLSIKASDEALKTKLGVKFSVGALGNFVLTPDLLASYIESKATQAHCVSNGAMILYGVLREMINTLSLKMPFGPLTIPTGSFGNLTRTSEDSKSELQIGKKLPKPKKSKKPA